MYSLLPNFGLNIKLNIFFGHIQNKKSNFKDFSQGENNVVPAFTGCTQPNRGQKFLGI